MADSDATDDLTPTGKSGDRGGPPSCDLGSDELVDEVQRRGREPQNLTTLYGFLGESDVPGHRRLFTDPTFKCWVDIPDREIFHRRRIPGEQDVHGGRSVVWVNIGAILVRGEVTIAGAEADFLTGPLSGETPLRPGDDDIDRATRERKVAFGYGSQNSTPSGRACC